MKDHLLKELGQEEVEQLKSLLPESVKQCYVQAQSENCNRIIWSNEGLFLLNSITEYDKLVSLFRPYSTQIRSICFFRNKASFCKAFRHELIHQGIPSKDDPDSYTYLSEDSWLLDYDHKKALLSQSFDHSTYENYNSEDAIQSFLDAANIPMESDGRKLNPTQKKSRIRWPFKQ